jgi:NADPH2:quinone reductase
MKMRAVIITSYGGIEGLEVREVETPGKPTATSVRVRVRAAALNRADILQRMGRYPALPGYPQDIPGLEFAGEVDEIGAEVRNWKPGERVFGIIGGGAQAEYVLAPANQLSQIPANLDWAAAAAIPEAFVTAHDALFTQAKLQMGETVLVHAAGSGVGTAAIQLARTAGAKVYGTSRTAEKLERAKQYGLRGAVVVGDNPGAFVDAVREWTNDSGANVILDLVGAAYFEANLSVLSQRGRIMLVGTTSGSKATLDFSITMRKRLTINGTVLRARADEEKARAIGLFTSNVVPLLADGTVRPVIDRTYNFEEIREAHSRLESNESFGKVVLLIN